MGGACFLFICGSGQSLESVGTELVYSIRAIQRSLPDLLINTLMFCCFQRSISLLGWNCNFLSFL
jgi:hypothetical protein